MAGAYINKAVACVLKGYWRANGRQTLRNSDGCKSVCPWMKEEKARKQGGLHQPQRRTPEPWVWLGSSLTSAKGI